MGLKSIIRISLAASLAFTASITSAETASTELNVYVGLASAIIVDCNEQALDFGDTEVKTGDRGGENIVSVDTYGKTSLSGGGEALPGNGSAGLCEVRGMKGVHGVVDVTFGQPAKTDIAGGEGGGALSVKSLDYRVERVDQTSASIHIGGALVIPNGIQPKDRGLYEGTTQVNVSIEMY